MQRCQIANEAFADLFVRPIDDFIKLFTRYCLSLPSRSELADLDCQVMAAVYRVSSSVLRSTKKFHSYSAFYPLILPLRQNEEKRYFFYPQEERDSKN